MIHSIACDKAAVFFDQCVDRSAVYVDSADN